MQVSIKRSKQIYNKLVLFGFVQLDRFKKGDKVLICDSVGRRKATVLEVYVYDPDVPANDLEVMLKTHMGKQKLDHWQTGWLILDDEDIVTDHTQSPEWIERKRRMKHEILYQLRRTIA